MKSLIIEDKLHEKIKMDAAREGKLLGKYVEDILNGKYRRRLQRHCYDILEQVIECTIQGKNKTVKEHSIQYCGLPEEFVPCVHADNQTHYNKEHQGMYVKHCLCRKPQC